MAARTFDDKRYSLEHKVCDLFAYVTFGNTGAPTLTASKSRGIKSVTRNSAGVFTFLLDDKYNRLLMANVVFILAAASYPAAPGLQVTADNSNAAAKTVVVQLSDADTPAATDPASGEVGLFQFTFNDSSV